MNDLKLFGLKTDLGEKRAVEQEYEVDVRYPGGWIENYKSEVATINGNRLTTLFTYQYSWIVLSFGVEVAALEDGTYEIANQPASPKIVQVGAVLEGAMIGGDWTGKLSYFRDKHTGFTIAYSCEHPNGHKVVRAKIKFK